jgi:putative membrane protein
MAPLEVRVSPELATDYSCETAARSRIYENGFKARGSNMKIKVVLLASLVCSIASAADKFPDEGFYRKAAEGGFAEVAQGNLAESKGKSLLVQQYGAIMVKDHSEANETLKALAMKKGIELPMISSVSGLTTQAKLDVMTGDSFDRSYIRGMLADHQEDIKDFEDEAKNGQDPDARAYAAATLPILKLHLKTIQEIAALAGVTED